MATEMRCDACGRTFQHEGSEQSVKCPYGRMTVNLPSAASAGSSAATPAGSPAAAEKSSASAAGAWHVFTCDGQRFGPISKDELDRWAEEKRLTASCQVYQDG